MTQVKEIKLAIKKLKKDEFVHIRKWLIELDWKNWDKQIEKDSRNGKLDFLVKEAKNGKITKKLKTL